MTCDSERLVALSEQASVVICVIGAQNRRENFVVRCVEERRLHRVPSVSLREKLRIKRVSRALEGQEPRGDIRKDWLAATSSFLNPELYLKLLRHSTVAKAYRKEE